MAEFHQNIAIFIDGSRTGQKGKEKAGASAVWKREGQWKVKGWHLGRGKTALDAELFALSQALKIALKQPQYDTVFTDSQSALDLIENGQGIPSIIREIWEDAGKLRDCGTPVTLL